MIVKALVHIARMHRPRFEGRSSKEPEVEAVVEVESETAPVQEPQSVSVSQSIYVDLADELKEFDFYFRGGLMDDARSVLDELPQKYAEHPEVVRRRWMLDL